MNPIIAMDSGLCDGFDTNRIPTTISTGHLDEKKTSDQVVEGSGLNLGELGEIRVCVRECVSVCVRVCESVCESV